MFPSNAMQNRTTLAGITWFRVVGGHCSLFALGVAVSVRFATAWQCVKVDNSYQAVAPSVSTTRLTDPAQNILHAP